jgi:deoxyribodipyrimidine photo-lyase
MTDQLTLFWFRQDLRLSDNPGLFAAAQNGHVMPIYIFDEKQGDAFKLGSASKWWLHHSLCSLDQSLNNNLNIFVGNAEDILLKLSHEKNIKAVYWNRCYEPWRIKEDTRVKAFLRDKGVEATSFNGSLLWEPWEILKADHTPYKVFTPYYRNGCLQATSPRIPLTKPECLSLVKDTDNRQNTLALNLMRGKEWHQKMEPHWKIGEEAAQEKLFSFLDQGLHGYKEKRNYPNKPNISKLSPHLHFGEISPNQAWQAAQIYGRVKNVDSDVDCFLSQLGWREFSHYLLYHFPELPRTNFHRKFDQFPWEENPHHLQCWQKGQTGYPIVDAGMRELWQTGFMHNRVRMIVASFLIKNLLIHWHHGEDWFWDCLVDADLANNSASWQWVAGSGADAAPYFRIFNPVAQGEKFDTEGTYTRHFVPELSQLPNQFLFKPWEAPDHVLNTCGIALGQTYPKPIINLKLSREQALQAYRTISSGQDHSS